MSVSVEDELRALAPLEPAASLSVRVRRAAQAELGAVGRSRERHMSARICVRVALPAAISFVVFGYLHWAVVTASAFYR